MPAKPDYPELQAARANWRYQPASELLAGRTILVTGAGDGIGRCAARTLANYGANLILLGRRQEKLEQVYDEIRASTTTDPVIVPLDLETTPYEGYQELAGMVQQHYGQLDGLLHNASLLGPRQPIEHYDPAFWPRLMQVNLNAVFYLTKTLLPLLQQAGDARILFTSSSVGRKGRAYWGAYAVSKAAVENLCQVLADELETEGRVRVNSINPGATRTQMRAMAYPGEDPATVPSAESHMDLYLYLLGPDGRQHHGQQFDARTWTGPDAA